MTRWNGFSLTSRIVLINGVLFALGTALLALSPATVSARPLTREIIVLLVGLTVMLVANTVLVRAALLPLERLVGQLQAELQFDPARTLFVDDSLPVRESIDQYSDRELRQIADHDRNRCRASHVNRRVDGVVDAECPIALALNA